MSRSKVVTLVLTGLIAFGLTACGEDTTSGEATGSGNDTNTEAASTPEEEADADADAANKAEVLDLEEAKEFVKITACAGAPAKTVGVSATIEITNPLDEPMEYNGSLNFVDGSGTAVAEGIFSSGTLEPGASTTEEIPGDIYEPVQNVTCELTEVRSDLPA
ncbi:hypothetical protein [Actinophytocola sediminis]